MSPAAQRTLQILTEIAMNGEPCPTNDKLADLANLGSATSTSIQINKLMREGLIESERANGGRRIYVRSINKWTGWTKRKTQRRIGGIQS